MSQQLKSLHEEERRKLITFHVTRTEYEEAVLKAIKYTQGNLSAWIRYAMAIEPAKRDLIEVPDGKRMTL